MLVPLHRWEASLQTVADMQSKAWQKMIRGVPSRNGIASRVVYLTSLLSGRSKKPSQVVLDQATTDGIINLLWIVAMLLIFMTPSSLCFALAVYHPTVFTVLLLVWLCVEAMFLVWRYGEYVRVSKGIVYNQLPPIEDVEMQLHRILGLRGVISPQDFFSGWFLGAPASSIKSDNVREFIAFGFYHSRSFKNLPEHYQAAVDEHIALIADKWQLSFEPGFNPNIDFMAHTREPLRALVHPLAFYAWGFFVAKCTGLLMRLQGFHGLNAPKDSLHYWHRPAFSSTATAAAATGTPDETAAAATSSGLLPSDVVEKPKVSDEASAGNNSTSKMDGYEEVKERSHLSSEQQQQPQSAERKEGEDENADVVVFVHGLGIGITPYLGFINMISSTAAASTAGRRGKAVIVIELPHLAFRLRTFVPTVDHLADDLCHILKRHGYKKAAVIGHSYGTFVTARFFRMHRNLVSSLGFIDPVCFLLCLPNIIFNFIYKLPGGAPSWSGLMGECLRFVMCSREFQVAQVLCRSFDWHSMDLWAEQLPKRTVVMVAEKDQIVPATHVRRYLDDNNVKVIFNSNLKHAQFLFRHDVQRQFLTAMEHHSQ